LEGLLSYIKILIAPAVHREHVVASLGVMRNSEVSSSFFFSFFFFEYIVDSCCIIVSEEIFQAQEKNFPVRVVDILSK
jgi:hypothetical protein